MTTFRNILIGIGILATGGLAGWLIPLRSPFSPRMEDFSVTADTLYIRDTIRENKPVLRAEIVIEGDEITVEDSLVIRRGDLIVLPRMQRYYSSEEYEAWVSGYDPVLDSVNVFRNTAYITNTVREVPKTNCIALESSASWCGRWGVSVTAEYTHEWRRLYLGGSAGYDFSAKSPYIGIKAGIPLYRWGRK